MTAAFTKITFTDSVKAVQSQQGSRAACARAEGGADSADVMGLSEAQFIQERDSFYQATVSETGWPYIQFRGGPAGFLKVLDPTTLGYADLRGNRQYISTGNIQADGRIALILMDYPNRRRLKIWGRANVVEEKDAPELLARLQMPGDRGNVERAIVIDVQAYDWNCPRHITPRFSEAEVGQWAGALQQELAQLQAENVRLKVALAAKC